MNAFRLHVGFTPSAPKVSAQLEAPVLPYLCRKALTPLLRLTALPRVAEHSSQNDFRAAVMLMKNQFHTGRLRNWWTAALDKHQIYSQGRLKNKVSRRAENKTDFSFLCSHPIFPTHIKNLHHIKWPSPLFSSDFFIPPSVYPHLWKRKFKLHVLWMIQGDSKRTKKRDTGLTDWWGRIALPQSDLKFGKIRLRDKLSQLKVSSADRI